MYEYDLNKSFFYFKRDDKIEVFKKELGLFNMIKPKCEKILKRNHQTENDIETEADLRF